MYVELPNRPILRLTGPDALDLIQRISTNDVSPLQLGAVVHTILTTEKGKVLDILSVVRVSMSEFLLFGMLTSRQELASWIERFIIMEEISVEDVTEDYFHVQLLWPSPLHAVGNDNRTTAIEVNQGAAPAALVMTDPLAKTFAVHMFGEKHLRASALAYLIGQSYSSAKESDLEELYIHRGLPVPGRELSREVNPHEAGILGLVSFTKGCYIGQEVIARLDTYRKVQRRLVSLNLSAPPQEVPQTLMAGSQAVGQLTSAIRSGDSWIGLGFVKSSQAESRSPLSYSTAQGSAVATVRVF